jgi:hypothetical protein
MYSCFDVILFIFNNWFYSSEVVLILILRFFLDWTLIYFHVLFILIVLLFCSCATFIGNNYKSFKEMYIDAPCLFVCLIMCCYISVGDVFVEPQMIYININPLTFNMFSKKI